MTTNSVLGQDQSTLRRAAYEHTRIANSPFMQDELDISEEQLIVLTELYRQYLKDHNSTSRENPGPGTRDRQVGIAESIEQRRTDAFIALDETYFNKVGEILLPHQIERFEQLRGWSALWAKGRFEFFYSEELVRVLKLSTDDVRKIKGASEKQRDRFMRETQERFETLRSDIVARFDEEQRVELEKLGGPTVWVDGPDHRNPALRRVDRDWDWEKTDVGLTAVNMHRAHNVVPIKELQLEITKDERERLNQVNRAVDMEYQERLRKESESGIVPVEQRYEIKLEIAKEYFKEVERILDRDQLWMHKAIQYERRSFILGPFRQYGDPWLLEHLEVGKQQRLEVMAEIDRSLMAYDQFLVSSTQSGWKKILREFPSEAKEKFASELGPMPNLGGHFRR